jgi:hypothetical protein
VSEPAGGHGHAHAGGPGPIDRGRFAWLLFGAVALAGGTIFGWNTGLLDALVTPPAVIRAALVGASAVAGLAALARAMRYLEAGRGMRAGDLGSREVATLVRGARYVFLAVAAFAAAAAWLLAHPLPLIVALVIAGVDVLETSFLLVVVTLRGER